MASLVFVRRLPSLVLSSGDGVFLFLAERLLVSSPMRKFSYGLNIPHVLRLALWVLVLDVLVCLGLWGYVRDPGVLLLVGGGVGFVAALRCLLGCMKRKDQWAWMLSPHSITFQLPHTNEESAITWDDVISFAPLNTASYVLVTKTSTIPIYGPHANHDLFVIEQLQEFVECFTHFWEEAKSTNATKTSSKDDQPSLDEGFSETSEEGNISPFEEVFEKFKRADAVGLKTLSGATLNEALRLGLEQQKAHSTAEEIQSIKTPQHDPYDDPFYDEDEEDSTMMVKLKGKIKRNRSENERSVPCLIVIAGSKVGEIFELTLPQTTLGRTEKADIQLEGGGVSRSHARLLLKIGEPASVFVEDLKSRNGTFLNGEEVVGAPLLQDGDTLTLGGSWILKFKYIKESLLRSHSEEELRAFRAGVVQITKQGRVISINDTARSMLGVDDYESQALTQQLLKRKVIRMASHFEEQESNVEIWQSTLDGVTLRCHAFPIKSPEGRAGGGVMHLYLDASLESLLDRESSLVSQQLLATVNEARLARQEAEKANTAKSEFLARMSHELRTPLNAILGYAELVREDVEEGEMESLMDDLQRISVSGRHLLSLVNAVLDISKLESGKVDVHVSTFSVKALMDDLETMTRPLAMKKNNTLIISSPENMGDIRSDQQLIKQILYNILSNACKFTIEGKINFDVSVRIQEGKRWIVWDIRDTGIGIPHDLQRRVFEDFVQVDTSTTRRFEGTGLGLAISQRLCELLGGRIHLTSEPDEGSHFVIEIPAEIPQLPPV